MKTKTYKTNYKDMTQTFVVEECTRKEFVELALWAIDAIEMGDVDTSVYVLYKDGREFMSSAEGGSEGKFMRTRIEFGVIVNDATQQVTGKYSVNEMGDVEYDDGTEAAEETVTTETETTEETATETTEEPTMTTTINHKHESTNGIRISKKKCAELAEAVNYLHNVNVTFYGRYEWDATGKSYVLIAERDELHAFKTQAEAYFFMSDLDWELAKAEQAAEAEATTTTVDADGEVCEDGTMVDERGEVVESDEQATDLSHMNTAAWQVACACCLVGTGCITNHFAFNYLFRDDIDVALAENVREARGMVAECIDRADEFRIEGKELDALADELRMLDAWLDANDHAEGTEEATTVTIIGEGYELTAYETEDGWQALGRIGGYDIDTVWCDCHGLSFDDLDSVILHVFESERRDRMMLAG